MNMKQRCKTFRQTFESSESRSSVSKLGDLKKDHIKTRYNRSTLSMFTICRGLLNSQLEKTLQSKVTIGSFVPRIPPNDGRWPATNGSSP